MRRIAWGASVTGMGVIVAAIGAIGALHTSGGRELMARLGVPCPVDKVSAEQVTHLRQVGSQALRGTVPAPARQALGMTLGQTTEADVKQWQKASGAQCETLQRGYPFVRCRGIPAAALGAEGPAVSELWFSFSPAGRLIAVDLYRRGLDDTGSQQAWSDARARMAKVFGAPARVTGDASPAVLRASALQTARVEYRFSDYFVALTAVNLPHAGLAVREQYTLVN
ncbi:hypothetical protein IM725_19935 [Ramlibacter aquaticus]|uniref:DUF4893 domain-containing protein n=1 Tax=Ramlibacter aquaticus TaxID=2780094 RepID=A0ABR9SKE0_9BURK|nr:hypothetical protein [Ramlibacter aquaticus]MBE7942841.1 hypothetical protein [Ramlibacter aquaticus]